MLPIQRALVSVSDKTGLDDFARALTAMGVEILSTGGTFKALEAAGVPVTAVSDVTEHPEILDGRVKTLHPRIHGGILADRRRAGHLGELQEHRIRPIDLVVCNLYPFRETIAGGATEEEAVEMIDIGGPTMIRAAAKNYHGVTVVVDPNDYPQVVAALEGGDRVVPTSLRRSLALKAFRHTQAYDAAIANWLTRQGSDDGEARFPRHLHLDLALDFVPRYGENPHQDAAVYRTLGEPGLFGGMEKLQGKELSYNNMLDADAARQQVAPFAEPAVVIVKHNNPCGVGRGDDLVAAYQRALACDPISAFGSIIAVNRPVDAAFVEAMQGLFVEVLLAPRFSDEALKRLAAKKRLRVLCCPVFEAGSGEATLRAIDGGFLAQAPDVETTDPASWEVATERTPTDDERRALDMAWTVARGVKSNAIVLARAEATVGIGAGQMSRVDSCRLAIQKAGDAKLDLVGCAAASDAFFPFRDGLDVLAAAGVTAIAQPGGSKRDGELVAAADEHGIAMVFTGRRHFRH
ncbi:MAG: bifunctional phosphoribosylaminoimidazolecarboxamide formyltransferase/IMP cyclohydrolase [Acidobacteriota bacterium]